MADKLRINISFKKHEKYMFDHINGQLSPTIYVKDLVKKDMKKSEDQKQDNKPKGIIF